MTRLRSNKRPKMGVNIVPLVDVLVVLIFFFLMTMQFKNLNVLDITPPKMETAGQNSVAEVILIGVDKNGEYFFNNAQISYNDLVNALSIAAKNSAQQSVLVLADENTPIKHMTSVMDASRKAGLERVKLQVR